VVDADPTEHAGATGPVEATSALNVEVLTIFPEVVESYCSASIIGRARRSGLLDLKVHDLREATKDPHRSVDDSPFGGGAGMVLAPGPVFAAVEKAQPVRPLYLCSPGGRRFDQAMAAELAAGSFSLLCGRYEGVDQRVVDHLVDGEISIGDYVLAGGELAALVIIEAVARLVPGVVGNEASVLDDSFTTGLLEYPQYTRPAEFRGWTVPEVLRGGDHGRIARWRHAEALRRTLERRPDLIAARGGLSGVEVQLLLEHGYPVGAVEASQAQRPGSAGAAASEERDLP
jgi:tRNA (guanine37-N1)-methyltransferase